MSDFKSLSEDELRSQQEALDNQIASLVDININLDDLAVDGNDDNISINSNDLTALDFGEGDDADLDKLLDDGADDKELKGLLGDDGDDFDMGAFDMDDPNLLAKLEADEGAKKPAAKTSNKPSQASTNKQQPTKKAPQSQPTQQQQQPKQQAATKAVVASTQVPEVDEDKSAKSKTPEPESQPETTPSAVSTQKASNKSSTEVKAKPKSTDTPEPPGASKTATATTTTTTTTKESRQVSAEKEKLRKEEYTKLITALEANITSFNNCITVLLADKTDASKQLATRYLGIRRLREKDLQTLKLAMKKNEPVPPYRYIPLDLRKELKNDHLTDDQLEVNIIHLANVKSNAKWFVKYSADLGTTQTGKTKTMRGSEFINFNHKGVSKIVPNARSSKSILSNLRKLRIRFELYKGGFIWDEKVGDGEMKANALMTETTTQSSVRIRSDSGDSLGDLEVKLVLHRPFNGRHIVTETINMVKLEAVGADEDVQAPSGSVKPSSAPTTSKPTPPAATTTSNSTTTASSKPADAPSSTATTPAAAPQKKPAAAAAGADDEFGQPLLTKLDIPQDITPAVINTCLDPTKIQSFDALTKEEELCEAMIAAIKSGQKQPLSLPEAQEKLQDIQRTKQFLEILVTSGKLSLDTYLSMLSDSINRDKELVKALMKLHKHFEPRDKEEAARFRSDAVSVLRRVKIMEEELKNAENMEDEDEEEE